MKKPGTYIDLERNGKTRGEGLLAAAAGAGVAATANRVGSMMTLFFAPGPVANYDDALTSDTKAYARFHAAMLSRGVYLAPSQFEAAFVSTAHSDEDLAATLRAAEDALAEPAQ